MITAIAIADRPEDLATLTAMIRENCPQLQLTASVVTPTNIIELIKGAKPGLLFVDIDSRNGNTESRLYSLTGLAPELIIISPADSTVETDHKPATQYLSKPLGGNQLKKAVKRAEMRMANSLPGHHSAQPQNFAGDPSADGYITVIEKGVAQYLPTADIHYIVAHGSYSHLHAGNRTFVSTRSLKDLEKMLPAPVFFRIHHGHIVNCSCITRIDNGRGGSVHMKGGRVLAIAVRRKEAFFTALKAWHSGADASK